MFKYLHCWYRGVTFDTMFKMVFKQGAIYPWLAEYEDTKEQLQLRNGPIKFVNDNWDEIPGCFLSYQNISKGSTIISNTYFPMREIY